MHRPNAPPERPSQTPSWDGGVPSDVCAIARRAGESDSTAIGTNHTTTPLATVLAIILRVLSPGGGLRLWVNCRTRYARRRRTADRSGGLEEVPMTTKRPPAPERSC